MNSKVLQDKVEEVEKDLIEMKLLKKVDKTESIHGDHDSIMCSNSSSMISLKHYDQVRIYQKSLNFIIIFFFSAHL